MTPTKPEFSGTFYDGKSANKYPVRLFLTKAQVELVFPDGRRISWLYPNLKLTKTSATSPARLERSNSNPNVIPESVVIEDPHFLHEAHRGGPGSVGNRLEPTPQKILEICVDDSGVGHTSSFCFCDLGVCHSRQ